MEKPTPTMPLSSPKARLARLTPAARSLLLNLAALFSFTAAGMGAGWALGGCVTVNVQFPESAVQKASDDYVRDIYRAKERSKSPNGEPSPTASPATGAAWSFFTEARADDDIFKMDSDKALAIKDRLKARVEEVINLKRSGAIGETNDGRLVIKEAGKLKKLQAKKAEKVVADENKDRDELYDEILRINGLQAARLKSVQKNFSRSFQAESPSSTWVESTDGKWAQKP